MPRKRKTTKPKTNACLCGCDGQTKGGRFLPGHDAKLKSRLHAEYQDGNRRSAAAQLSKLGWPTPAKH